MGTSKVITLADGNRILDIECDCGTHSTIISEDVYEHTCTCGKIYFNIAYYYYDKDSMICFNDHYYKLKRNKEFVEMLDNQPPTQYSPEQEKEFQEIWDSDAKAIEDMERQRKELEEESAKYP